MKISYRKIYLSIVTIFCSICLLFFTGCKLGRGFRYTYGGNYIGSNPSMSPDGSKIVFGSPRYDRGDICMINTDGSNWVRLTNTSAYEAEPKFSPDGSKIVFISERDDGNTGHIYLMNANGSNQIPLTHSEYYDSSPSFSPDGRKIVFNRLYGKYNYEIFLINADGSNEKRLTFSEAEEAYPAFTPDGNKIYYNPSDKKGIWEMNIDGSHQTLMMDMATIIEKADFPIFSPDGQKIVFTSWKDTNYTVYPYTITEIYIMNADRSNLKQLTHTKTYKSDPTLSPDGSKILFFEPEEDGRGKGKICVINVDGSNLRVVSNNY